MDNKSKLGYSKNSPYKNEPVINIQSNKITMKDTDKDILGIGIKNGEIAKVISMKAGESKNYDFGDVDSVLEIPKFQAGGMFGDPRLQQMNISTVFPLRREGVSGTIQPDYDYFNDPENKMMGRNQVTEMESYLNERRDIGSTTRPPQQSVLEFQSNPLQDTDQPQIPQQEGITQNDITRNQSQSTETNINPYNNQQPTPPTQFFNPYGGVDLETAWSGFGRGLASDENKGLTALYGAKSILGTARNFMGGFASQKRNEEVEDYYRKQQQQMREGNYTYAEDGGEVKYQDGGSYLTDSDINSIRKSIDDKVRFTDDTVRNMFERVPQSSTEASIPDVNLGRYADVGYFDVAANKPDSIVLRNTQRNPHNPSTIKNVMKEIRQLNPDRNIELQYLENGGMAEKLTGEYTEGLANENSEKAVAEIEDGEYMQYPDGEVMEVKGEKHENGGEKMTAEQMEEGTKIISDNLKVGKENAKYFRDKYEIKLKAKDTYATVVDKISKKMGIKDIVSEQEEVIKKMEKNQNADGETTQKLNLQFLSKKLKDLEEKKLPLEETRKVMVDDVFEKQEASKPKEEKTAENKMEDGGSFDRAMIETIAKKHNIPFESAIQIVEEYEKGGKYKDIPKYQDGGQTERLKSFYNQAKALGFEGEIDFEAEDLGAEAGKLQAFMAQAAPDQVVRYFTENNQPITSKGVELLKSQNPEVFEATGIDPNKKPIDYSTEERITLQQKFIEQGENTDEFFLNQFQDNLWNYRAPVIGVQNEMQSQPRQGQTLEGERLQTSTPTPTGFQGQQTQEEAESSTDSRGMAQMLNLPDQSVMMPNSVSPHLHNQYRFGRIDYRNQTPDRQLSELGSQLQTGIASLNERPDSQRVAALAQIMAGTQGAANEAIGRTDLANQQARTQAELYNTRAADREMTSNAAERQRLEQLQYRAKEITEQDWRDYQDYNRRLQMTNYRAVQDRNLLNQLYDNYFLSGSGEVQLRNPSRINSITPKIK